MFRVYYHPVTILILNGVFMNVISLLTFFLLLYVLVLICLPNITANMIGVCFLSIHSCYGASVFIFSIRSIIGSIIILIFMLLL